jgi:nicotinic acid phosphoribosyltransferase
VTTYQGFLNDGRDRGQRLGFYEFSLGVVIASSGDEAEQVASVNGMWDKRPDGTWGHEASDAHAQLIADEQAAYRYLARRRKEQL